MKTPRETDGISPQVTVAKLCLKILRLTAKQMSSNTNSHQAKAFTNGIRQEFVNLDLKARPNL